MPNLLAIVRRIAGMSPDEIRTRARMAIRQQLDVWAARRGKNPLHPHYSSGRTGVVPRFFFAVGEAAIVATAIKQRLPSECDSVIENARRIQGRSFDLLGYRGLSFGDANLEWQSDPVHCITAPVEPWFRIPYLDFDRVGDHKIVWELNRHQHLMLLARAWLYTRDRQFLDALQSLWDNWRNTNPYPMGINWASTLEVAFRCLSWIWIDHLTAGAPDLPENFRTRLRDGIGEAAVYIERYVSTYFAPNTHLLGELLALFFVGVLYPGFEKAQCWREYAWSMLVQESSKQVRKDGFHFEQSVYYHVYALDMFLHARILAAHNGIPIPESYDSTLRLMAEALASIAAAGQAPRFGDDDGGRLFDGRRNRTQHLLDPLAAAAIIYGRADWKAVAGDLREETIWLLGIDGIRMFDQMPRASRAPFSQAFQASGYYIMSSAHGIAIVDAGPHGWGNGGHGHADALSLQLIAGGRAWLTDPGTGSYPAARPERDLFRSTAAHNTLEVDGASQADPIHAFAWGLHPVTTVRRWYIGERITLFNASHDGYMRLTPAVTHARWVIAWRDDVWMVADRASGNGEHRLDLRWHAAPECTLTPGDHTNAWRLTAGPDTLEIVTSAGAEWNAAVETGSWSPCYGAVIPAPVLRLSQQGPLPAHCTTVFALNQLSRVSLWSVRGDGVVAYFLMMDNVQRLIALAERPGVWNFEALRSDAELLVIERSSDIVEHVLSSGGSEVRIDGEPLALERKGESVWEGRANNPHRPWLSQSAAKALLRVLDYLSASRPPSVSSALPETGRSR